MKTSIDDLASLFSALADPTRLRILGLLLAGEVCVCHLHESLRITQPKASRHLAYLRRAGLVVARREGLWAHYRLADATDPIRRTIQDTVTHALGHLESIHRDADRLQKKTGCCAPVADAPTMACCGNGLPPRGQAPWMRYAGLVESGNPRSSQTVDEVVYGSKD